MLYFGVVYTFYANYHRISASIVQWCRPIDIISWFTCHVFWILTMQTYREGLLLWHLIYVEILLDTNYEYIVPPSTIKPIFKPITALFYMCSSMTGRIKLVFVRNGHRNYCHWFVLGKQDYLAPLNGFQCSNEADEFTKTVFKRYDLLHKLLFVNGHVLFWAIYEIRKLPLVFSTLYHQFTRGNLNRGSMGEV